MTDHANELRRLAQAATQHVGRACNYQDAHSPREGHVDFENADLFIASERPQEDAAFYAAANPVVILELLDRLEAAEADALEQARLNGMGSEREAALMAKLEAAEKTNREWLRANAPGGWIDNLRATIAEMEKMQDALRRLHEMAMGAGLDPSHSLTKLRVSACQQSCLYADTVAALEELK